MKRKLLESVNRNLNFIKEMLPKVAILEMGKDYPLSKKELVLIKTIEQVYLQQKQMYDENTNTCKERIVSIYQPHVRPILRGKQNARVEFEPNLVLV
jgi:IS5 family transposase